MKEKDFGKCIHNSLDLLEQKAYSFVTLNKHFLSYQQIHFCQLTCILFLQLYYLKLKWAQKHALDSVRYLPKKKYN